MTLTKAGLVDAVVTKLGFSRSQTYDIVETVFEIMKQCLEKGEKLKISGFGNFSPRDKRSRLGRNPKTGEPMEITARRVVTFKASPVLKNKMNNNPAD
jgi:integration host factor subunit alpha